MHQPLQTRLFTGLWSLDTGEMSLEGVGVMCLLLEVVGRWVNGCTESTVLGHLNLMSWLLNSVQVFRSGDDPRLFPAHHDHTI